MKRKVLAIVILSLILVSSLFLSSCGGDKDELVTVTFMVDGTIFMTKTTTEGNGVLPPEVPVKEGYIGSWDVSNFDIITSNLLVYAVYTPKKFTITFKAEDNNRNNRIIATYTNIEYGSKLENVPEVPEREGHSGVWETFDRNFISGNLDVNAVYTKNSYKITFEKNGAQGPDDFTGLYGDLLPTNFTLSGYELMGWYKTSDFSGQPTSTVPAGNITLYAKWLPLQFTVTVDLGSPALNYEINKPQGGVIESLVEPSRNGYVFNGWYLADGTLAEFPLMVESDITIIAEWIEDNRDEASSPNLFLFDPDNQSISLKNGITLPENLIIPSVYNNVAVTAIANEGFSERQITHLTIPASIKRIGQSAFEGSTISTITFVSGSLLSEIDEDAFRGVVLTRIALPSSLKSIGQNAFNNAETLQYITFDNVNGLTYIGYQAFDGTAWLSDRKNILGENWTMLTIGKVLYAANPAALSGTVMVPSEINYISPKAFENCLNIVQINIPSVVKAVGERAFSGCASLEKVVFPVNSQLNEMGENAYENCSALIQAGVPSSTQAKIYFNTTAGSGFYQVASGAYAPLSLTDITVIGEGEIADYAFNGFVSLENVKLFGKFTKIGDFAFANCENITEISIGKDVTYIGEKAFSGNTSLALVAFESGSLIETIADFAFENTINAYFDFGGNLNKLKNIGKNAFFRCENLVSFSAPSIENIGSNAFSRCLALESASIPLSVQSAYDVFENSPLESVRLVPNEMYSIVAAGLFESFETLTAVTFMEGITSIGDRAFKNTSIAQINLPVSLVSIGIEAFSSISELTQVTFAQGSKLEEIGEFTFKDCTGILNLNLPSNVNSFAVNSVFGTENLKAINVAADNEDYFSVGGVLYQDEYLLYYPSGKTELNYTVPEGIKGIRSNAFTYESVALKNLVLPATLTEADVDFASIAGKIKLDSLTVSGGTQYLAPFSNKFQVDKLVVYGEKIVSGFLTSSEIIELDIIGNIKEIRYDAFGSLSLLEKLTISAPVQTIFSNAFAGMSSLAEIEILLSSVLKKVGKDSFAGSAFVDDTDDFVIISDSILYSYNGTDAEIVIPESIRLIADSAFENYAVEDEDILITLPANLEYIGASAFSGVALKDISFGDNIIEIGDYAFSGTQISSLGLTSNALVRIGDYAFSGIAELAEVELPDSLNYIGEEAFGGSALLSITIPASVRFVGENAFRDNTSLSEILFEYLSYDVFIGKNAFDNTAWYNSGVGNILLYLSDGENEYIAGYKGTPDETLRIERGAGILSNAFNGLQGLNMLLVASSELTFIGDLAFKGSSIRTFALADEKMHLTYIGAEAFADCENLNIFNIPDSLTNIDFDIFEGSVNLSEIRVSVNSPSFSVADKIVYNKEKTQILFVPYALSDETIRIADGVTEIPDRAFKNRDRLHGVVFPAALTRIGKEAFMNATELQSVEFNRSSTIESVGEYAFYGTSLQKIDFVTHVDSIGAFALTGINEIIFAGNPPLADSDFASASANILVPWDKLAAYKEAMKAYEENIKPSTVRITFYNKSAVVAFYDIKYNTPFNKILPQLPQADPESGYSLAWDENYSKVTNGEYLHTENLDIHLIYTAIKYTIEFEGTETPIASILLEKGDRISALPTPAEEAKAFVGWSTDENELSPFNLTVMPARDITLYAVWFEFYYEFFDAFENSYKVVGSSDNYGEDNKIRNIPDTYKGLNVVAIEAGAFGNSSIKHLSIGRYVESIGEESFKDSDIISISFNGNSALRFIHDKAFYSCENLATIAGIENAAIESVGEEAFAYCVSLIAINIRADFDTIAKKAFYRTSSLQSAEITAINPDKEYTDFSNESIFEASGVKSVILPANVTVLPSRSFAYAHNLKEMDMSAFTVISDSAFESSGIKVALLPNVITIEEYAFYKADGLNRVYLNPNIMAVRPYAFAECDSLMSFRLPISLAEGGLGDNIFTNTQNALKYIIFEGDQPYHNAENIGLDRSTVIYSTVTASQSYQGLSDSIAYYEFIYNDYVINENTLLFYTGMENTLELPYYVNEKWIYTINMDVFISSYGIQEIKIPTGIHSYFNNGEAFSKVATLKLIKLFDGATIINNNGVLYNSAMTVLIAYPSDKDELIFEIPGSVERIASFAFKSARNLNTLVINSSSVVNVDPNAFSEYSDNLKIYVPKTLFQDYLGNASWADYTRLLYSDFEKYDDFYIAKLQDGNYAITQYTGNQTSVTLPYSVNGKNITTIGSHAFQNTNITDLIIPGSVKYIKPYAFANSKLVNVTIQGPLEELGEYAFMNSKQLTTVSFAAAAKLETLKQHTFVGCVSLMSFDLPNSVTTIERYAFKDCTNLISISVKRGSMLKTISDRAFYESSLTALDLSNATVLETIGEKSFFNSRLVNVKLPESLRTIGDEAFAHNLSLRSLIILGASKLVSIGSSAFSDCRLETINIPEKTTTIGDYAFAWNGTKYINFASGSQLYSIGQYAFAGASEITQLYFYNRLAYIGSGAFSGSENLLRVTFSSEVPPSFSQTAPFGRNVRIYVPDIALNTYKNNKAANWKDFTDSVNKVSNVSGDYSYTEYGQGVEIFQYLGADTDIVIPDKINGLTVLSIGAYSFNYKVRSIDLSQAVSVTTLKPMAFYKTAITEFTITASVTTINGNPFANCDELETIILENNDLFTLIDGVLFDYTVKKLIAFPNKAFTGSEYYIPDSVSEIGEGAFRGVGEGIGAFTGDLRIPFTINTIGANAFRNTTINLIFEDAGALRFVGEFAFESSIWLEQTDDGLIYISSEGFASYNKALYGVKGEISGTVVIAEGVEAILPSALINSTGITAITLPSTLKYAAEGFLAGSYNITSVTTVADYPLGHIFGTNNFAGSYAAFNPYSNKTYYLPTGLTSVEIVSGASSKAIDYLIANCVQVTDLTIDGSISYTGRYLAYGTNMRISSITVREGVEGIGSYAFTTLPQLTSVYIPASVKYINSFAFADNSSLASVTFDDDSVLEHIGASAFMNNIALTAIQIPCYVKYIGVRAFKNCRSLTSLTFDYYPEVINVDTVISSSELYEIGDEAFMNCIYLMEVSTPNKLQILGDRVFYDCSSFVNFYYRSQDVTTPFTYIGNEVFKGTQFFTNEMQNKIGFITYGGVIYSYNDGGSPKNLLEVPENIVSISPYALVNTTYNNTQINYITDSRPQTIQKLDGNGAPMLDENNNPIYEYRVRTGVRTIYGENGEVIGKEDIIIVLSELEYARTTILVLGRNVERIGAFALSELLSLNKVLLPNSVKEIDDYAFFGCQSLTEVTNTEGVSKVGIDAFYGTTWYTNFKNNFDGDLIYIGKAAYEYIGSSFATNTQLEIAEGTESLTPYLFKNQNGVIVVKFPESVKDIGQFAINATRDGVTESLLHTVYVANPNVENVAGALTVASKVILNSAPVMLKGKCVYKYESTESGGTTVELTDTIYLSELLTQLKSAGKLPLIYVPSQFYESYLIADVWCELADYIRPFDLIYNDFVLEKVQDGYNIVYYAGTAADMVIPDSVEVEGVTWGDIIGIRSYAFNPYVRSVVLGSNITYLYAYSFAKAINLESVDMSSSKLVSIGDYAFNMCYELDNVVLPDTVISVGNYAFAYCESLTNIQLGQVETIGDSAFIYCVGLTEIIVPETVTALGTYIFNNCTNLIRLEIHSTVPPTVSASGLYSSASIVQIYVPASAYGAYMNSPNWMRYENRMHLLP